MYIHVYIIYISIYHVYPSMSILFFYFSYRQRRSKGQCYGSASQLYPSMSTKTSLNDSSAVCSGSPLPAAAMITGQMWWALKWPYQFMECAYVCVQDRSCQFLHHTPSVGSSFGHCWVVIGSSLGHRWVIAGSSFGLLGHRWVIIGSLLGRHWVIAGSSLGHRLWGGHRWVIGGS